MSKTVIQVFDALPESEGEIKVVRDEELLLTIPSPPNGMKMKLWRDMEPLKVTNFAQMWKPAPFSPPRDVFAGKCLRLEWQQMDGRQPFYHRNADVQEISYQVDGERTLMTELGTIELRAGDWSRIPVGIAHDNYGRKEIHLLFYMHGPVDETGEVDRVAEHKKIPFDGWKVTKPSKEMVTECLGALGCDLAVFQIDEEIMLAGEMMGDQGKLSVQRSTPNDGNVEWLYKAANVYLGTAQLTNAKGDIYRCHRRGNAIHYQISGTRTLVTQRGMVNLEPGDFIMIPKGVAYTSIAAGETSHIVILTTEDIPMKAEPSKTADPVNFNVVQGVRHGV